MIFASPDKYWLTSHHSFILNHFRLLHLGKNMQRRRVLTMTRDLEKIVHFDKSSDCVGLAFYAFLTEITVITASVT